MGAEHDLSGRWTGVYFYPVDPERNPDDDLPPTAFTAEIVDANGHITGSTLETDQIDPWAPAEIRAVIDGHRLKDDLFFTKFPDGRQTHTIDYHGTVSSDGNSIGGAWIIHGEWSGTFQMQRRISPAAAANRTTVGAET